MVTGNDVGLVFAVGSRPIRFLALSLQAKCSISPIDDDRPDYLFSKVTPLIAFKNTTVTLETNNVNIQNGNL